MEVRSEQPQTTHIEEVRVHSGREVIMLSDGSMDLQSSKTLGLLDLG